MFQEKTLYPWLTLEVNVALELQKVAKAHARLQARMTLQGSLRQLIREERPTVLLVMHDVDEALFLADQILVFSQHPAKVLCEFNLNHHKKSIIFPNLPPFCGIFFTCLGFATSRTNAQKTKGSCSMRVNLKPWLLIPVLLLSLTGPASANEKFKIGYLRMMDDAPVIAAYEGGFYKKHGLDVELIEFKSGTDLIKAIVGGQRDSVLLSLQRRRSGGGACGTQHGYHALLVRDDSGIQADRRLLPCQANPEDA